MIRKFLIALSFLVVAGCNDLNLSDTEKYEIYSTVFDRSVGKVNMWRKKEKGSLLRLTNSVKTKADSLKYPKLLLWIDSVNKIIDTANFYVIVEDTLISNLANFNQWVAFQNNDLLKKDTIFNTIFKSLFVSTKNSIATIDKAKIKPQDNYLLVDKKYNYKSEFKEVGTLLFSIIFYNNQKDKACVYASLHCGELCGHGQIFFLEKKKGKWAIIDYIEVWTS